MDISNMNVDQLKILAYDLMEKVDVFNRDLTLVRNRITYLLQLSEQPQMPNMPPIPPVASSDLKTTTEHTKTHKK